MADMMTGSVRTTRTARLRLVHLDPWSVGKTACVLSIALGVTIVVATIALWIVLAASGVWSSINSAINSTAAGSSTSTFDITHYLGFGTVVGFALIASAINVVVMTVMSALFAVLYNLASVLLGGVDVTLAEER